VKISVVIPTYRRPDSLNRCLEGLRQQDRSADEVLVVTQDGDEESLRIAELWSHWPAVKVLRQAGGGAVGQYNLGLESSGGDVIAITDDDSIPRPDWLARIERRLIENQDLGGVGGRDIVHENGGTLHGNARLVGIVQWFGRIVHNHHLGTRIAPNIDILKGVNMSFRAAAIGGLRFDKDLRGEGAQVCLDMAFSLAVQKRKWRLLFDPEVIVDHFPAPRFDPDQRTAPSLQAIENSSYNLFLTLRRHMKPGWRRRMALCWAYWIGIERAPGFIRGLVSSLRGDKAGIAMRAAARRAWNAARHDCVRLKPL
jgi:cellulose synthase/poly-beta-1,6-N-acetylglucosamine synthase-like glycosyltransferase